MGDGDHENETASWFVELKGKLSPTNSSSVYGKVMNDPSTPIGFQNNGFSTWNLLTSLVWKTVASPESCDWPSWLKGCW